MSAGRQAFDRHDPHTLGRAAPPEARPEAARRGAVRPPGRAGPCVAGGADMQVSTVTRAQVLSLMRKGAGPAGVAADAPSRSRNTPSAVTSFALAGLPACGCRGFGPGGPPAFPACASGFGGPLRSRSRGRLRFGRAPRRSQSLSHSLFACHKTGTSAASPEASSAPLSSNGRDHGRTETDRSG